MFLWFLHNWTTKRTSIGLRLAEYRLKSIEKVVHLKWLFFATFTFFTLSFFLVCPLYFRWLLSQQFDVHLMLSLINHTKKLGSQKWLFEVQTKRCWMVQNPQKHLFIIQTLLHKLGKKCLQSHIELRVHFQAIIMHLVFVWKTYNWNWLTDNCKKQRKDWS